MPGKILNICKHRDSAAECTLTVPLLHMHGFKNKIIEIKFITYYILVSSTSKNIILKKYSVLCKVTQLNHSFAENEVF